MWKKPSFWRRYKKPTIFIGLAILLVAFFAFPLLVRAELVNAYASLLAAVGTVGAIFTTIWLATNQNRIAAGEAVARQVTAKKAILVISKEAFDCFMKIDKDLRGKVGVPVRNERLEQIAYSSLVALKGIDLMHLPDERLIQPISTLISCLERRLVYNPDDNSLGDEALLYILASSARDSIEAYTKN